MPRLANKTALITGGSSGIGLETARQFIAEGARVAITGTSQARLDHARAVLGPDALVLRADSADVAAQRRLAAEIATAFGRLDILFANAGIAAMKPIADWSEEEYDRILAVNLKGPFFLVQALLPVFSNPASIVLNGSVNARIGMPNSAVYSASKAGVASLARTLSGELLGRGIRANVINPGPVATPIHDTLAATQAERDVLAASIKAAVPAGRFGVAAEIARAAVYFASDESAFTVGSELVIDGGVSNL